jgi:hypothetical protein
MDHRVAFRAYPIAAAFWYSFTDYHGMMEPSFIGIQNYTGLIGDPDVGGSVVNTLIYTAMAIPAGIVSALAIAIILNTKMRALPFYRTLFFLPILVPDVALSIVWLQMFNPQFGLVNALIEGIGHLFGLQILGPGWLASTTWAKPTLVLLNVWLIGQPMIIHARGAPGRSPGPARRRERGRRELVPAALVSLDPNGHAGDLLPARDRPDRRAPALHPAVRHYRRRRVAGPVDDVLRDAALPRGVRLLQHGPGRGDGLDALPGGAHFEFHCV